MHSLEQIEQMNADPELKELVSRYHSWRAAKHILQLRRGLEQVVQFATEESQVLEYCEHHNIGPLNISLKLKALGERAATLAAL